jgi:hypothetical protein
MQHACFAGLSARFGPSGLARQHFSFFAAKVLPGCARRAGATDRASEADKSPGEAGDVLISCLAKPGSVLTRREAPC